MESTMTASAAATSPIKAEDPTITLLVKLLRRRARMAKLRAIFVLFLIIGALASGLYLFVNAGRITRYDISGVKWAVVPIGNRPKEEKTQVETEIQQLRSEIAVLASQVQEKATPIDVSTLATRLGSVLILLFLVQILVTLYRYTIRVAAFYDGRADAILFASLASTNLSFMDAGTFFTPTNVDFGKVPRSPAEHALELVKESFLSGKQLAKG
jgi:hypothetical protein